MPKKTNMQAASSVPTKILACSLERLRVPERARDARYEPELPDAMFSRETGLPLDECFAFTLDARDNIPAINPNGYQDAQSTRHWHGEGGESSETYRQLSMVEHANPFEKG